jgi:hypothetical protein
MLGPGFDPFLGQRLVVRGDGERRPVEESDTESTEQFAVITGRRAALGAVAAAVVAVQAFGDSTEASNRRGKRGRRGRRGKKGPQGPQGPSEIVDSTVESGDIAALPVVSTIGDQATSVATCGDGSILLGCGFEVSTTGVGTTPDAALSNAIPDVVPDAGDGTCTATLTRTGLISGTITAAAQIQAYAICSA